MNPVGDYRDGTMILLFGVMCAFYERTASGQGQVVDAAMVEGIAALMFVFRGYSQNGKFDETKRGGHHFDSVDRPQRRQDPRE